MTSQTHDTTSHGAAGRNTVRALEIMADVAELPSGERDAQIVAACDGDPALEREVRGLLAAAERPHGILEYPIDGTSAVTLSAAIHGALAESYVIGDEIGRGGMSTVFRAREHKHGRDVVIKVLDPSIASLFGPDRFLREIRIAANLAHPHIVPLLDSGAAGGLLYYVMPFMEGHSLRQRLVEGPLPLEEARTLLLDVASALAFAHDRGVVHRDLKPENVFVASGHAYLLDFGIAKLLDDSHPGGDGGTLTKPGLPLGTRRYMAPEQFFAADEADARTDVFAWGLLADEVLGLRLSPYAASIPVGATADRAARPEVPASLRELVRDCIASAPGARPASMDVVLARLGADPTCTPTDVPACPPSAAASSARPRVLARRRWPILAALVAVVAAALVWKWKTPAGEVDVGGLREPLAMSVLRNETGDSSLTVIGRYAGDWVTDGLQRLGSVRVVSWSDALVASDRAEREGRPLLDALRDELQAGTVITGTYYRLRDSLHLQARLVNVRSGQVVATLLPIVVDKDRPEDAVSQLRDRVLGAVAAARDAQVSALPDVARNPPSFSAYQAFNLGFNQFLAQEYGEALTSFREAHRRDPSFTVALLLGARAAWNTRQIALADSLVTLARGQASELSEYHAASLRYFEALLQGEGARSREAVAKAAAIAPNSRAAYDHATALLNAGFAREADSVLGRMNPDQGEMRGWSSYWTQRAHAAYLLGRHDLERTQAQTLAERFPDRRVAQVLEARALAASGNLRALDSALVAWDALPVSVYWSRGSALVVAGEELIRRGRTSEGAAYASQGVQWLTNRLVITPLDRGHRFWLGRALYSLERYAEARPYFESLAKEFPDRTRYRGLAALVVARLEGRDAGMARLGPVDPFERGLHEFYRARVAAVSGEREQAILLFTSAAGHGVDGLTWEIASAFRDIEALQSDPRVQALFAVR
ncbi:MAG: FlgO family outer membrane protein [Gemmatimonadota bacterium]